MPGEADDYLYVAISQTQFVFAKVMKGVSPYDTANFLDDLRRNAPAGVSSVITSDHEAFGHPAERPWQPKFPDRIHGAVTVIWETDFRDTERARAIFTGKPSCGCRSPS